MEGVWFGNLEMLRLKLNIQHFSKLGISGDAYLQGDVKVTQNSRYYKNENIMSRINKDANL